MILSHQSGIPISGSPKFDFEPGTAYGYSGLPLMYLQKIIEDQTGKSLEVLAQEEIFTPLGMTHSSFLPPAKPSYMGHTQSSRAKSKEKEHKPNAANSLHTTASDFAKLVNAWMNDPSEIMQQAFRPQVSLTKDNWARDMGVSEDDCSHLAWGCGFGLELDDEGNVVSAFHTGDMNQWRAQVAMNLEDRTAVVYFANGRHHKDANGHVLSDAIITPNITLKHAMSWFYTKFGFARNTKGDWKEQESMRMNVIVNYLSTGITPQESGAALISKAKLAIEILIYDPRNGPEHSTKRGVMVNPRLRDRFDTFVPIGVYKDEVGDFQYYLFSECDDPKLKTYNTLKKLLETHVPTLLSPRGGNPKLYVIGHSNGGYYGMSNYHGQSEHFHDASFDRLIEHYKEICADKAGMYVTLEGCNTDSQIDADKVEGIPPFLARLSENHHEIIFGGSGPWDVESSTVAPNETGYRALSPTSPVTSMVGNVWKARNSVIFYHNDIQIRAIKSLFASTQSAMALKINTVNYARALSLDDETIQAVALRRDIQTIQDLRKVNAFSGRRPNASFIQHMKAQEQIITAEYDTYVLRVRKILDKESTPTSREIVLLLLGLKDTSVFTLHPGGDSVLKELLSRHELLSLAMVSCGKVLVGGPSNDHLIDFLIKNGIDVNTTDERGMSALHYAVQTFYNYRDEPLHLIDTLLTRGANAQLKDNEGETPKGIASKHTGDPRVSGGEQLLLSLETDHSFKSEKEVQLAVRSVFQMDEHIKQQMLSSEDYRTCMVGTLYMPESKAINVSLLSILDRISDNADYIDVFCKELKKTVVELEKGSTNTGQVMVNGKQTQKSFPDIGSEFDAVYEKVEELKSGFEQESTSQMSM